MSSSSYIGVTDFASHAQVVEALDCVPETTDRLLHVGVMSSYKTINGIPTRTGWEDIWPNQEEMREIFQPHPRVFNVLHYADYEEPPLTTETDLIRACNMAGPYLQGLQLDMVWPSARLIRATKRAFPSLKVILQVGKKALYEMEGLSSSLGYELVQYKDCVDYFLIDWSMGRGEPIDVERVLNYLDEAVSVIPHWHFAVAGGLGPDTYQTLRNVFRLYPHISCDAQGQMRSSGKSTDPIEMDRVRGYLEGICSLLT